MRSRRRAILRYSIDISVCLNWRGLVLGRWRAHCGRTRLRRARSVVVWTRLGLYVLGRLSLGEG
jgi:hypothetical protein